MRSCWLLLDAHDNGSQILTMEESLALHEPVGPPAECSKKAAPKERENGSKGRNQGNSVC